MAVETRCGRPIGQRGAIGARIDTDIASCERNTIIIAKTIVGSLIEAEYVADSLVDEQVVVGIELLPILLDE